MFFLPEVVLSQRFGLHFEMRNLLYPPGIKQEGDKIFFRWGGTTHNERILVVKAILSTRKFDTSYRILGIWDSPTEVEKGIPRKGKTAFLFRYGGHCLYGHSDHETVSLFDGNRTAPKKRGGG